MLAADNSMLSDPIHLHGDCRSYLRIPASLQLLVAFTGLVVLYHHVPGPSGKASVVADGGLLDEELEDPEH